MKVQLKKDGCHMCSRWSALTGCNHYNPQDYELNKPIIDAIVAAMHTGNEKIIETTDFMQGINAALIALRQNDLIK